MDEKIVLKYDKKTAIKVGALSYKLYVFMLWMAALIVLISSAVFDFICYQKGFSNVIIIKYTSKIIYLSLFLILVWIFTFPVWAPAHFAENSVFVKNGKKLYRIRCKKDDFFDREKYLDNNEFLDKVIENLPNTNKNVKITEFEEYSVLKKNEKNMTISVKFKNREGKEIFKNIKIYNIYDNYNKL